METACVWKYDDHVEFTYLGRRKGESSTIYWKRSVILPPVSNKAKLTRKCRLSPATAAHVANGLTYGGKVDIACAGILARLAAILALADVAADGETAELAFSQKIRLTIRCGRSHHCRVAFCVVRRRVSLQSHRTR